MTIRLASGGEIQRAKESGSGVRQRPNTITQTFLLAARVIGCASLVCSLVVANDALGGARPIVTNSLLTIGFDAHRGELQQLSASAQRHDFIAHSSKIALWQITTADGRQLIPDDAKSFVWQRDSNRLVLQWSRFANDDELRVIASITLDGGSSTSHWRILVAGLQKVTIRTVVFPRIGLIAAGERETLAVPQWIGEMTNQIRQIVNPSGNKENGTRREWDYPGMLSMQFIAYYTGAGPGMLVSTDDDQLLRKQFAVFGDGAGGLGLEVTHHVPQERDAISTFSLPYSVTVQTFDGDWFTAAELYRQWASKQRWARESRSRQHQTPEWVRNTALWVWNRGASENVLTPAVALQENANLPVSVFWHWWHGCAYDVGFPEYLLPREGADKFKGAVAAAKAHGIHELVYMNQRLWGMTTKSWTAENAAAWAVKDVDGKIRAEVYNSFVKAPCASMCMGTPFWRNKYASLAERAVTELGVSGIYMDQACTSLACYDPSHGHPLGGGNYWMDGFKTLEHDIRERCKPASDVALAGEGCGEGWLPFLDLMLSLQVSMERYAAPNEWEPVPIFNVVYHDCATQFGNYSSLTRPPYDELWPKDSAPTEPLAFLDQKFAAQFRLEQARAFVWGQQPTIANFQLRQLRERPDEMSFLLRLARLRMKALKYLRDGVFLRPPAINSPRMDIPISRLSIYAGQKDAVKEYRKEVPPVLASAVRAADGGIAIILVNISDQSVSLSVPMRQTGWPLPLNGNVYRLTEAGRKRRGEFAEEGESLVISLGPGEASIYEIVAK